VRLVRHKKGELISKPVKEIEKSHHFHLYVRGFAPCATEPTALVVLFPSIDHCTV